MKESFDKLWLRRAGYACGLFVLLCLGAAVWSSGEGPLLMLLKHSSCVVGVLLAGPLAYYGHIFWLRLSLSKRVKIGIVCVWGALSLAAMLWCGVEAGILVALGLGLHTTFSLVWSESTAHFLGMRRAAWRVALFLVGATALYAAWPAAYFVRQALETLADQQKVPSGFIYLGVAFAMLSPLNVMLLLSALARRKALECLAEPE